MEKAKRYCMFLIGLFISSFGVSLITKADLGTSPISAIPYVLSLNFPWSLGQFTVAFSLVLILLQLLILRRNFTPEHLLQIPISVAFGYFIDLTMQLLSFLAPQSYPVKLLDLVLGCVVLGFGWASASIWRSWRTWLCCRESPSCGQWFTPGKRISGSPKSALMYPLP